MSAGSGGSLEGQRCRVCSGEACDFLPPLYNTISAQSSRTYPLRHEDRRLRLKVEGEALTLRCSALSPRGFRSPYGLSRSLPAYGGVPSLLEAEGNGARGSFGCLLFLACHCAGCTLSPKTLTKATRSSWTISKEQVELQCADARPK